MVKATELIDPRFTDVPQPAFEVMLTVVNAEGEEDAIYMEFSRRYGSGNNAQKTQAQMSMDSLLLIGWTGGMDFSQVQTLVGKQVNYRAKMNTKGYMNVYVSAFAPKSISAADAAQRAAAMMHGAAPTPAPTPAAAPAAPAPYTPPNPFGGAAPAAPAQHANPFC